MTEVLPTPGAERGAHVGEPPSFTLQGLSHRRGFALRGEVDLRTAPLLWEALVRECDGGEDIHLDLSGVTFMDSTGLSVLVRTVRAMDTSAMLVLDNVPAQVLRLFDLIRLETLSGVAIRLGD